MSYTTIAGLGVSLIFTLFFIPAFNEVSNTILEEVMIEQELSMRKDNHYKKMFNSLQEGIIVISKEKLVLMNELSQKLINNVSGLKNFFKNINHEGEENSESQMDMKIFYCIDAK